jgi:putative effector of murein hydrolase LrgA (UPF0299 family)
MGRAAQLLRAAALLALATWAGEALSAAAALPLPGILAGMGLLLAALSLWPAGIAWLEPLTGPLLSVMVLLFIPAGAKVVALAPRLAADWLPIGAVVLGSTLLAVAVTAWTVQALARWVSPGERP